MKNGTKISDGAISDEELDRQIEAANERTRKHPNRTPRALSIKYHPEQEKTILEFENWSLIFDARTLSELAGATTDELREVRLRGADTVEWTTLDVHISVGGVIFAVVGEQFINWEVARRRGTIKSPKRAAASKMNGARGGRPPKAKAAEDKI